MSDAEILAMLDGAEAALTLGFSVWLGYVGKALYDFINRKG